MLSNRSEFSFVNNSGGHIFFHKFTAVILIMPVKNFLFLICFAVFSLPALAQQSGTPDYNYTTDKNAAKKQRMNQMMKMDEEGDIIFNHYGVFGFKLATNGYGI